MSLTLAERGVDSKLAFQTRDIRFGFSPDARGMFAFAEKPSNFPEIEVIHIPTNSDIGQEQWQKAIQGVIDNNKIPIVVAQEFKPRPAIAGNNGIHDISAELLGVHGEIIEKTSIVTGYAKTVRSIRISAYFLSHLGDMLSTVDGETGFSYHGELEKVVISEIDPENAKYTVFSSFDSEVKALDHPGEHVLYQAA